MLSLVLVSVLAPAPSATGLHPGDVVVGDADGSVTVYDSAGTTRHTYSCEVCSAVRDVALSGVDHIHVLAEMEETSGRFAVLTIDAATGKVEILVDLPGTPGGIAVAAGGEILVTTNDSSGGGRVIGIDTSTAAERMILNTGTLSRAAGVDVHTDGTIFVAGDIVDGRRQIPGVVKIEPNGASRAVAVGSEDRQAINLPVDVTVAGDGMVFVLDMRFRGHSGQDEGRVYRVDEESGTQELVTIGIEGPDRRLSDQLFVGLDMNGHLLYMVDLAVGSTRGGVNTLDPATGAFTSITPEADLEAPSGLDTVPGGLSPPEDSSSPVGGILVVAVLVAIVGGAGWVTWQTRREEG